MNVMEKERRLAVEPKRGARYRGYLFAKRLFDIVFSVVAIVCLSPILLLLVLIKWLEDFHNPVYVSDRVGKDGRVFRFYKLRSMAPDADREKQALIDAGQNEVDGPAFKIRDDPRITPFGRFLRKTSADELLQLINILKGDMSVVGPRPPLPSEVERYTDYQMGRLRIKGGLLCLWQIQPNRHAIPFDDWVELDLEYIQKQSFWLDMKILFRGIYMVLSGKSGD